MKSALKVTVNEHPTLNHDVNEFALNNRDVPDLPNPQSVFLANLSWFDPFSTLSFACYTVRP